MAILATLFGAVGRFAGKLVNSALGWASLLLFGRVPQNKQILLSVVTLGSVAWVVCLLGVLLPDLGALLLAAVPLPHFVDRTWVRLAMLAGAIVLPLLIGAGSLVLLDKARRPKGAGLLVGLLRGYPFSLLLAVTLVFLAAIASVRKARTLVRRWEDAHVPVVVKPGGYDRVVDELRAAMDGAGLGVERRAAPVVLSAPARLLAVMAGPGVQQLVPDRLAELAAPSLEVLVYPSDIAIAGRKDEVAAARAAIATRLTRAPAYLTTSAEAQAVEDQLESTARLVQGAGRRPGEDVGHRARTDLRRVDTRLASLTVAYEEWEVLYRMRLQVERDLLAAETGRAAPERGGAAALLGGAGAGRPRPSSGAAGPALPVGPGVQWAASLVGFLLVALDVLLVLADRIAPPPRRRLPWE
ncbi:MAG TPA: hypothetical protein VF763_10700 [Candidatus Limnocylindrales bacterium]